MSETSNDAAAAAFDDNASDFAAWQASPWGRLRYRLVAHTLAQVIAVLEPQCRILDVGGADGRDSVPLARQGHYVTIVDQSDVFLRRACASAEAVGAADRVRTVCCDIGRLVDRRLLTGDDEPRSAFDVVICHNVLQYVADPLLHIRNMMALLRVGGLLSVMAPNPAMDVLARAVRCTDPAGAFATLDASTVLSVTFCQQMRRITAVEGEQMLVTCGARVTDRFGIRCVTDLIVDQDIKCDPDFFADLERLELALCQREPYWRTAKFWQLVALRTSSARRRRQQ
ncbi:class I SAM-dependent methyltransferase [Mycobacterium sp.]|uniref:class I SAM-dependent methyltransferase n=1 Tax=Mycobacterium sp. TaxID=1785 RepID=UPI002BA4E580|nr:methyltransferase [Mycobacterium sp.]HTY35358.1 methyltransferase [Mycobacterium sp.]